ncbi:MAG TPA: hypothetical protein VMF31_08430 [Solirubrobacterales bacterium]|nr:hypothetical protein [Solirubrobacterales bacterium]
MSVADLESPPDTEPGWKLDPLGVGAWRWWNGEKWLLETAGDPPGKQTFGARIKSLPLWARIALPFAGAAIIYVEYLTLSGSSPLDVVLWLSPGMW